MYQNVILFQIVSIICLVGLSGVFIATFVPQFNFDYEIEHPNIVKLVLAFMIIGYLRGAF